MFTFGIFTTHLPYIAFVLFYGFFFLVGIEKASAGEMGESEKIIPQEITVAIDNYVDDDDNSNYNYTIYPGENDFEQLLFYETKINLCNCLNSCRITKGYRFSWFSRPPPVS